MDAIEFFMRAPDAVKSLTSLVCSHPVFSQGLACTGLMLRTAQELHSHKCHGLLDALFVEAPHSHAMIPTD